MTAETLHDALGLLPADLVTAADRVRCRPRKKRIRWTRLIPAAACLALILYGGLFVSRLRMGSAGSTAAADWAPEVAENAVMETAAAAAGNSREEDVLTGDSGDAKTEAGQTHTHAPAETPQTVEDPVDGWCGNMEATVYLEGVTYSLSGSDAVALTDILINLDYDPEAVCDCAAELTVDTETLTGISVNLTQSFARCERGQAALTTEQAETIRDILDWLEGGTP